jgi:hypothetical protein
MGSVVHVSTNRDETRETDMTYTSPAGHGSIEATMTDVLNGSNIYTLVTEIDEFLGRPITASWGEDLVRRYDMVLHLTADEVRRAVETLSEFSRATMIFAGRIDDRHDLPTVIPVGYTYPTVDGRPVWAKVNAA